MRLNGAYGPAFWLVAAMAGLAINDLATQAADKPAGRLGCQQTIVQVMRKVNQYQRTHPWRPSDRTWIRSTYYTGVMALYRTTGDPQVLEQALGWAEKHGWAEGNDGPPANKKTCGQTYLELYFINPIPARIAKIRQYVDRRMAAIAAGESPLVGWSYCDTLYVGPPTIAMLGKATGEQKYYDYLNRVYWTVVDHLFDQEAGLFYRDARYRGAKSNNGRKVFWSRGNGWVMAGIPRVLEYLPRENPHYERYVHLLRTMASALAPRQGADGLWRANLDDPKEYPNPETSGTAFFCYALAWGINHGVLEKDKYLPVVGQAWAGLVRCIDPQGRLGYVQPVGAAPAPAAKDSTHEYAVGALLLAGSEMHKLCGQLPDSVFRSPTDITVFAQDGGWCWFQDPRAMIHQGKLIVGSVSGSGPRAGDVRVTVFDLKSGRNLGTFVLHAKLETDDHAAPAFYARPDGRILAMYAKHSSLAHYYRISEPNDPTRWGEEKMYKHPKPVTYMNLYYHPADRLLYNFFRDHIRATWCPWYLVSKDQGDTWQLGGQLIQHELQGKQRPYPRYWSDGEYIHIAFTDAHPQEYPRCSIYYAKYKAGKVYKADGALIKDIRKDGPLVPREADLVFQGGPQNGAWTSSIRTDTKGHVYVGYSVRKSPSDHRFRYAVWDGTRWNDHQLAYAGAGLYPRSYDYTGLITIDPSDPRRVFFSTNVHPQHGTCTTSGKHEIYEATTATNGQSWHITPITHDSKAANIRPICIAGDGFTALLWLRGRYRTYVDYDTDVVGIIRRW